MALSSVCCTFGAAGNACAAPAPTSPSTKTFLSEWRELQGQRTVPNTFFATTTHWNSEILVQTLADMNMRAVRLDFMHRLLEPAPGQYAFEQDNRVIKSADLGVEHGLDQLALISHPADWIKVQGQVEGMFPNDDGAAALEEFAYRIARKYKGRIKYWQAGNEPYMPQWRERYVTLIKAVSKGVKRADPDNKVVMSGFCGGMSGYESLEADFLEIFYQCGGKEYVDILASHPYVWPFMLEESRFLRTIGRMRAVMEKYGDDKPLWLTEIGWSGVEPSMLGHLEVNSGFWHRHRSVSEEDQARYTARLFLISATIPWIERVYQFHLYDQDTPYTSVVENADTYMGLLTPWMPGQFRPKDAYFAVKTVIRMIAEATYKEQVLVDEDPAGTGQEGTAEEVRIWALVFERGEEATIAIWSLDDDTIMTLEDMSTIESVTSMIGTPVLFSSREIPVSELKNEDGVVAVREDRVVTWDGPNALRLSGRPIYVKANLKNLDRLKKQIANSRIHTAVPR